MVISVFDLMRRFKLEPSGKACAYVGVSYAKMDDKHKFHGWMVRYISKSTPSSSLSSVLRHTCRKFAHFGLTAYARKLRTWCQQEGLGEPEHLAILQAMGNGARNELGAKMKEAIAKRAWYGTPGDVIDVSRSFLTETRVQMSSFLFTQSFEVLAQSNFCIGWNSAVYWFP